MKSFEQMNHTCFGLPVIVDPLLVKVKRNKILIKKRWMSDSYFRRIQKKWDKKFGFYNEPGFVVSSNHVIIHPILYAALKNRLSN